MTNPSALLVIASGLSVLALACSDTPPSYEEVQAELVAYEAQQRQQPHTGGDGGTCRIPFSSQNATCDACLQGRCCQAIVTCTSDQGCAGLIGCIDQCSRNVNAQAPNAQATFNQCMQGCTTQFAAAMPKYQAYGQCFQTNCSQVCK